MFKKAIPKLFFSNYDEVINKKKDKRYKHIASIPLIIYLAVLVLSMVYSVEFIRENIKPPWKFEAWIVYTAMAISLGLGGFFFWCIKDNFKNISKMFYSITSQSAVITYFSCNMTDNVFIQFVILMAAWVATLYFYFLALTDTKIKFNGYSLMAVGFLVALNIMLDRDLVYFFEQVSGFWKGG